jgi:predicted transcriptional regulator
MAPFKKRKIVDDIWEKLEPIFLVAQALSHQGRFRVIMALLKAERPLSLFEIKTFCGEEFSSPQISSYIKILEKRGIIVKKSNGSRCYYQLDEQKKRLIEKLIQKILVYIRTVQK